MSNTITEEYIKEMLNKNLFGVIFPKDKSAKSAERMVDMIEELGEYEDKVLFRLKSPSLRGIGAGFCCAMISQQLGGYGNQVLMQFPNCLIFYGGLAIVYVLPHIENEWIAYEEEQLAKEAEKKRLKEEKKKTSRV